MIDCVASNNAGNLEDLKPDRAPMHEDLYHTLECLHDSPRTIVFRARKVENDAPIIIKRLKGLYPSAREVAHFQREFDITRAAASPWVSKALELNSRDGALWMVLEDFGGTSLASLHRNRDLPLRKTLKIAASLIEAIGAVHRCGIVHKDIKPSNVVMNPETGRMKLVDFGIASVVQREVTSTASSSTFEGSPVYMSPEQTGRMNRTLDYRSDFYSFGVLLYKMLAGRAPFKGGNLLDLVHAHIALQPDPLHTLKPEVPEVLSELVSTLLAKRAEDRYQSSSGILHDLQKCLQLLDQHGNIPSFPLREEDREEDLRISESLYGRFQEKELLQRSFERVSSGRTEVVLVTGYSGIGKTSLVRELYKPMTARRANLISGKFDQYHRGIPYAPVLQAFRQVVQQILSSDADHLHTWGQRLQGALGSNGKVLTEVIHELELIIGPQPPLEKTPAQEAENRFIRVFLSFVRALAAKEHPLVIFLDDLQWADLPSLRLLEEIACDPKAEHIMLIGAYRDNEVLRAHPLQRTLSRIRDSGVRLENVQLGPLQEHNISQMLAATLRCNEPRVESLARVCAHKTHGNPFFLKQFLEGLHRDEILYFDTFQNAWAWDLASIETASITDNVVEFMSTQLQQLPRDVQRCLHLGACIGNQFSLQNLEALTGQSREALQHALWTALQRNLIHPVSPSYWIGSKIEGHQLPDFSFTFAHDRIQQAAYAELDAEETQHIHLSIGRELLKTLTPRERSERLFEIVEHLSRGAHNIRSQEELDQLIDMNLEAGRKAIQSAAYEPAHRLLSFAVALTDKSHWKRRYDKTLEIFLAAAEAAYLSGNTEAMHARVRSVETQSRTLLDRIRASEIQILGTIAQNNLVKAVMQALDVLEELGFSIPRAPGDEDVVAQLHRTMAVLGEQTEEELLALPDLKDPKIQAARRLIVNISSAAYLAAPNLLPLLAFELVRSTVNHGLSPESPYGFALLALVLSAALEIKPGYLYGELALKLLERWDERSPGIRPGHVVNGHVRYWTLPLRDTLPEVLKVHENGLDTGNIEYGLWSAHIYCCSSFYAGCELNALSEEVASFRDLMKRHHQHAQLGVTDQYAQIIDNLRGMSNNPLLLIGPDYHEDLAMTEYAEANYRGAAFILTTCKAMLRVLFQHYEEAAQICKDGEKYQDGAVSTFHLAVFTFYDAIAHLAQENPSPEDLERAQKARDKIDVWTRSCPANFAHRKALIEAELARVQGQQLIAMERYDQAIELAREHRFVQDEALANERTALFHKERGSSTTARAYLLEARYAYQQWGALSKVLHLEQEHQEVFLGSVSSLSHLGVADTFSHATLTQIPTSTSSNTRHNALDFEAMLKASRALSGAIRLDQLLQILMEALLQNSGATRGFLLRKENQRWHIEIAEDAARARLAPRFTQLAQCKQLPSSIIHYVDRTNDELVLEDARIDPRFQSDPYLRKAPYISILCCPIVHHGTQTAMIYLENDLTPGAFTAERLETVKILAAQAAISIENASLVGDLEERIQMRTSELEDALQNAKAANKVKSNFLGQMSHELRTPLTAILGKAESLLQLNLNAKARKDLGTIETAGRHLLGLINELLDMARIESGKLGLSPAETDLEKLAYEVVSFVDHGGKRESRASIHTSLRLGGSKTVLVDAKRLKQVLLNLLGNAVKFTPEGDVYLTLEVLNKEDGEVKVHFEVRDTGCGIFPEDLGKIFDPFEQTGSQEQRNKGAGLGLSISKQIVHQMQGELRVESTPGEGSRFWFTLPLPLLSCELHPGEPTEIVHLHSEHKAQETPMPSMQYPPRAVLQDLSELASDGAIPSIHNRALEMIASESLAPFGEHLLQMATAFDDRGIQEWMKSLLRS